MKQALRIAAAGGLLAAALLLAGCSGVGANTGTVTLTVYNGNDSSNGTFDYRNVYVDNKTLVSLDIPAGQSATVKVDTGQHSMFYTFDATPDSGGGGSYTHSLGSGTDTFTIPSASTVWTWNGPVWPSH